MLVLWLDGSHLISILYNMNESKGSSWNIASDLGCHSIVTLRIWALSAEH